MISNAHKQILTFGFVLLCHSIYLPPIYAAGNKWFQIELIVFSNHNPQDLESEKWPHNTKQYQASKYAEITSNRAILSQSPPDRFAPIIFQALPEKNLSLQKVVRRLDDSNEYQVLLHTGWQQWVKKRHKPIPIYLDDTDINHSYQSVNAGFSALTTASIDQNQTHQNLAINNKPSTSSYEIRPAGPPEVNVYGMISLRQGRFLHLALDLSHRRYQRIAPTIIKENIQFPMETIPATPSITETDQLALRLESQVTQPVHYHLKESRRIATNKLLYFDHPTFGVIAKVSRLKAPPSPAEDVNTPTGIVNMENQ